MATPSLTQDTGKPHQQAQRQTSSPPNQTMHTTAMEGYRSSADCYAGLQAAATLNGLLTPRGSRQSTPNLPSRSQSSSTTPSWPWSRAIMQVAHSIGQQQPSSHTHTNQPKENATHASSSNPESGVSGSASTPIVARARTSSGVSAGSTDNGEDSGDNSRSSSSTGSSKKRDNPDSISNSKATATMTSEAYTKMVEEAEAEIRTLKQQKAEAQQRAARSWKSAGGSNASSNQATNEVGVLHNKLIALKKQTRALKNKASAMRCREKKRRRMEDLVVTVASLKAQVRTLQQDNSRLRSALELANVSGSQKHTHAPQQQQPQHLHAQAQQRRLQTASLPPSQQQHIFSQTQLRHQQHGTARRPMSAPVSPRYPPSGICGMFSGLPSPPVSPRATNVPAAATATKAGNNNSSDSLGHSSTTPENQLAMTGAEHLLRLTTVAGLMRRPGI